MRHSTGLIKRYFLRAATLLLAALAVPVQAASVEVRGVRVWDGEERTRIVFDLSAPVEHSVFSLENPDRLVIDLENADLASSLGGEISLPLDILPLVRNVRSAPRERDDLRVVFDLAGGTRTKSFLVKPSGDFGHRLVLDLEPTESLQQAQALEPSKSVTDVRPSARPLVVAIDAGHGGKDSGAIGPGGTREKDVALSIARELARQVDAQPGMRAVMIREGDEYLYLSERREKARQHSADIFISIHADAFTDRRARGASVYVVSERGATSMAAELLAERENAADLVGGVSLADKDDVVRSVLVDLSQTATLSASLTVGQRVMDRVASVTRPHKTKVQQAGFIVLKSPDVPSILVETAFISNPSEERKLRDRNHQKRLAAAIVQGVQDHFLANPPPGTLFAAWQGRGDGEAPVHSVSSGETLSGIARQYKVSVNTLRAANGKSNDRLSVGEQLVIPLGT
ncbi:MAG: N-acetylmuramoyl-L-alanine amidase [Gammaproteobacteria bacterium]|nr:N-acetylmuramoyl-L-alanine amidase [Gammaproteobacteria bacterium]